MRIKVKSYVTFKNIIMSNLIIKSNLNFFISILSLCFEIMTIFLKKYKKTQVFNTYVTIKTHIEYLKIKWPLWCHKSLINIHELLESCLERRSKLLKFKLLYLRD